MFVAEVQINSFRHLKNVHIGPLSAPKKNSDMIVLAGPNGGGKSSILDLLAFALSNTWGWTWTVHRSFPDSSFELRFGLSEGDLARIEAQVTEHPDFDPNQVLPDLKERRSYFRGFNFPEGEYGRDSALHDRIHQLVSRSLGEHTRAMYLRSDRYYSRHTYRKERIFDSSLRRSQSGYWRSITFTPTDEQYVDQIEFLIEQMYNYPRQVGQHVLDQGDGNQRLDPPPDPLAPYDTLFQELFPQYQLVRSSGDAPADQLYIRLPNQVELPFTDLSSGEQEVFFILSFFLRHDIRDSMVFIDEPELHLHPELVRRMVRIMMKIRPANQLWLGTHNAELIDEAGTDRTYFVYRPTPDGPGTAIRASDDPSYLRQLRTMFGYSGYVGLARKLVFLEGDASSADRRVLVNLFPEHADQIRFVPLNSSDNALRVNRAVLAILSEGLGHCEFFLVRDRDHLPDNVRQKLQADASGRLFILKRHEIENYLLDSLTISEVLEELVGLHETPAQVDDSLRDTACSMAGAFLRDMLSARLNANFQTHDCSIGSFAAHQTWLDNSLNWNSTTIDEATQRFTQNFKEGWNQLAQTPPTKVVAKEMDSAKKEIVRALKGADWKALFPGKELIEKFGVAKGFKKGPVFINAIIRQLALHPSRIDQELRKIVDRIVQD